MSDDIKPPNLDRYLQLRRLFPATEPNPKGAPSLLTRQLILHQYSPKVSVISSDLVDQIVSKYQFDKFLTFLQYFQDQIYGLNSLLSNNNKVHARFVKPIDELLRVQLDLKNDRRNQLSSELFEIGMLKPMDPIDDNLNYTRLITNISSSLTILPFETFNHPILQLIVISLEDSLQSVKTLINDWKYLKYPEWIDLQNMLLMFLIIADSNKDDALQKAIKLQEHLKLQLNYRSVIVSQKDEEELVEMSPPIGTECEFLPNRKIGVKFKQTMDLMIVDLINKYLVPFMERKMHHWNEDIVGPRRSFTGRLFSVGKRWGSNSLDQSSSSQHNYNSVDNFYYTNSNEYLIRKLGDWYFMLKDYKKSYATYEMLKKDFLNDKSWNYLASLQEFMIMSLLIGSSQKVSAIGNGITPKIITDLINPMIDSLQYSYLSRCYLKTYSLRSIITIAELFISLGELNQVLKINNNNSIYFDQSQRLLNKLIDLSLIDEANKPVMMRRISYIYAIYYLDVTSGIVKKKTKKADDEEEGQDAEDCECKKMYYREDLEIIGLTRYRKSELWDHLANTQQQQQQQEVVV